MPRTEGREDTDLVEMALEKEVTMSITKLDIDTDELIDWVLELMRTLQVWKMMTMNLEH